MCSLLEIYSFLDDAKLFGIKKKNQDLQMGITWTPQNYENNKKKMLIRALARVHTCTYCCQRETSETTVLPVGQQSFEGDLTHALVCWQQPRPVPRPLDHGTLLMYEERVLLVINQG